MKKYKITNGLKTFVATQTTTEDGVKFFNVKFDNQLPLYLDAGRWNALGFTIEEIKPLEPRVFEGVVAGRPSTWEPLGKYLDLYEGKEFRVTVEEM